MRLFIAINFDDDVHSRLLDLRDEVRSCSERGSFVLDDNVHLTLVFLGECDSAQVEAAKSAMNGVVFESFDLYIDSLGRFKRDDGNLWWAGVRESLGLFDLHRDLSNQLKRSGFKLESRKYSPHITLGRKVVTEMTPRRIDPFRQQVYGIDLMKSERIDGILTYTSIYYKAGQK